MIFRRKKNDQPLIWIYLKNIVALIQFQLLKLIIPNKHADSASNYLFVNTGQIGDLIISTLLFVNEDLFKDDETVFLLIRKDFESIFSCYNGKIRLIYWDDTQYRVSLLYKIKFIYYLQSLKIKTAINITTARGPLNDELVYFSNAHGLIGYYNDGKYLKRIFGDYYDKQYTKLYHFNKKTEYEKQYEILSGITNRKIKHGTKYFLSNELIRNSKSTLENYKPPVGKRTIILNPFSDIKEKDWPIEKYKELIVLLSENNFVVLCQGAKYQKERIDLLINGVQNVYNLAGKYSLIESAGLLSVCDLYIGNDSGYSHIAKALKKKYVAIIGCGSFGKFYPYLSSKNETLLYKEVKCAGCEWRCTQERRYCIEDISVREVYENISILMESK